MEIYVLKDQIVMHGKVKDLMHNLNELAKDYHTLKELIMAHLH